MNQATKIFLAVTIMFGSAVWGYAGDRFGDNLHNLKGRIKDWFTSSSPAQQETAQENSQPLAPASSEPSAAPALPNNTVAISPTKPANSNPFQQAATNPYAQFLSSPQKGNNSNLNKTLDSIRPGQVQEGQEVKRNLYFEKLSEQLKQLQGENPPPPPPQGHDSGAGPNVEGTNSVQANPFGGNNPTNQLPAPGSPPPPGSALGTAEDEADVDGVDEDYSADAGAGDEATEEE